MNTYEDVAELANWEKFAQETGAFSTHNECHNSVTWLALQIKKEGFSDWNVHLCSGVFAGMDHSWVQVEDEKGDQMIVDMTVDQFGGHMQMPYVGPVCPGYELHESVVLCEMDKVHEFIERLGG